MTPGSIIPVVFHAPDLTRTEKYVVKNVYDQTVDGTLISVAFNQDGPMLSLVNVPFGQTYVQYMA